MSEPISEFHGKYFFLSNFYPVQITIDGKTYKSSEHYYQACKATDPQEHEVIRTSPTPASSKKEAKRIKSFRKDWDTHRLVVMAKVLTMKFQNPELRKALLDTGDSELIEGNHWGDCFWGVCRGEGKNYLGRMLMKVRTKIKNGEI